MSRVASKAINTGPCLAIGSSDAYVSHPAVTRGVIEEGGYSGSYACGAAWSATYLSPGRQAANAESDAVKHESKDDVAAKQRTRGMRTQRFGLFGRRDQIAAWRGFLCVSFSKDTSPLGSRAVGTR